MANRKKIAILFSGKGSNFAYIVKCLHKQEFEVVIALTNNPRAEGIEVAKRASIPAEVIDSKAYGSREAFDIVVVEKLQQYNPDLTVLVGFMRILTPFFTEQIKAINLHPSLLPRHKGLNAIEKSYKDEYLYGGVSTHYVSSQLDGGKVILQKEIAKDRLSFEEYDERVRNVEKEVIVETIRLVLN